MICRCKGKIVWLVYDLFWKGKIVSLLYDLSLEGKKLFCCCMICPRKGKIVSLLYDLSLERKNCFVALMICPKLCKILLYHVLYRSHPINYIASSKCLRSMESVL